METFIIVAMLYFLVTGLTNIGLTITKFLPRSREDYTPPSVLSYYVFGSLLLAMAFWAAVVL
jgi:hypothetical protein